MTDHEYNQTKELIMSTLNPATMAPANAGTRVYDGNPPGNSSAAGEPAADGGSGLDFGALLGAGLELQSIAPVSGEIPTAAPSAADEGSTRVWPDPAAILNTLPTLPPNLPGTGIAERATVPAAEVRGASADAAERAIVSPAPLRAAADIAGENGAKAVSAVNVRDLLGAMPGQKNGLADPAPLPDARGARPRSDAAVFPGTAAAVIASRSDPTVDRDLVQPRAAPMDLPPPAHAGLALGHGRDPAPMAEPALNARLESLPQRFGTPAWEEGFASRVVWMAKGDIQTAEIRLNPAELGPIEVKLSLSGDKNSDATVQFSAAHAATRDAIEAAMPRLREMMQDSGIALGKASVDAGHTGSAGREQLADSRHGQSASPDTAEGVDPAPLSASAPQRFRNGLVDTFA